MNGFINRPCNCAHDKMREWYPGSSPARWLIHLHRSEMAQYVIPPAVSLMKCVVGAFSHIGPGPFRAQILLWLIELQLALGPQYGNGLRLGRMQ